MPQISPRRSLTALALAAAAVGSLLITAPAAHAGDYLDACFNSVGHRTSPNGWNIPARNFAQGSSGVCVKELQFDISSTIGIDPEDWDGFVDGRFGPKTDEYVRRFQQASGLQVDGIVGPRTWESLVSRTKD
ncbi:peptidoglycan-binding domain-containing protein [Streptomyces kutzneri]|uniref:peptidoglycan-binding domain-containing protein n=1 Tax=Streptomyces kutzneri TaxID=3051179 RepID=UPI0028D37AA8|nr:peptidoglycan-binding domain-containing protein [Streptomyces sp. DSM 40907]